MRIATPSVIYLRRIEPLMSEDVDSVLEHVDDTDYEAGRGIGAAREFLRPALL